MAKINPLRPATAGSFKAGNQAAKGRGRKPKLAELREVDLLRDVFNAERLRKLLEVIYARALDGDSHCIRFVAERFFPSEFISRSIAGDERT
ncbi:MAG: hypothetical protein ACYTDT_00805 [Planctomycetota bacterium]|jgi:hypothetical protein